VPGSTPRIPDLSERQFERILLVKPSSLGDVVHALPVLHGLRARYPQARIDWLVGSAFAPLLEACAEVDRLVLFDRRRYRRLARDVSAVRDFVRFLRELRAARYDLVVDLQGLFRSGFLSRATRAGVRLGLGSAREGARIFYTHTVPVDDRDAHAVDRNYCVAQALGFGHVPVTFGLTLPPAVRAEASDLLRGEGVGPTEPWVAVVPGARWETKMWLPERFAAVIGRLQTDGRRCVLLGGPEDADLCAEIAATAVSAPVNLAGRTQLGHLAALVGTADVVLCHDSGAMHLAVAQDRPVVCLIGPTNPRRTGPYHRPHEVLQIDLDCSPCYLRRRSQCAWEHRCMTELGVDAVVAAVHRALERRSLQPA